VSILSLQELSRTNLEEGKHLTFFLSVEQAVVVLHGDERSEVVRDSIVCRERQRDVPPPGVAFTHSAWRGLGEVDEWPFVG